MKINSKQYARVLYDLTAGKSEADIDGVIIKFAEELKRGGWLKLADEIIEKFNEIWNEQNGIVEAEITASRELDDAIINKIKDFIKNKYSVKKVVLSAQGAAPAGGQGSVSGGKNRVDKSLKGGIIIKVGDEIIDGSVAGRLRELKAKLRI